MRYRRVKQGPSCYQVRTVLLLPWWPRGPCCTVENQPQGRPECARVRSPIACNLDLLKVSTNTHPVRC